MDLLTAFFTPSPMLWDGPSQPTGGTAMSDQTDDQPTPQDQPGEDILDSVGIFDVGSIPSDTAEVVAALMSRVFARRGTMIDLPAVRIDLPEQIYMVVETEEDETDVGFAYSAVVVDDGGTALPLMTVGIERALRMLLRFGDQLDAGKTYAMVVMDAKFAIADPLQAARKVATTIAMAQMAMSDED